jgi:hypothetical protein
LHISIFRYWHYLSNIGVGNCLDILMLIFLNDKILTTQPHDLNEE